MSLTRRRWAATAVTAGLLAALLSAAAPGTARGATVERTPALVSYQAAAGATDVVTVTEVAGSVRVENEAGLTTNSCSAASPTSIVCDAAPLLAVTLLDGNDQLMLGSGSVFAGTRFAVDGGPGNDQVTGAAAGDDLTGGPGSDAINGNGGDDILRAQDGEADLLICGTGSDTVIADAADQIGADCESGLPDDGGGAACDKAKAKRAAARRKLKKLKTRDASKKAIHKAKAKLNKRTAAVKAACAT